MDEETKPSLNEIHKKHRDDYWAWSEGRMKNWRAWGSWFSWGSPIGLTLGYAIVVISTGATVYLFALASHVK